MQHQCGTCYCFSMQQQRNTSATEMPSKTPPLCTVTWSTTGEIYGDRKSGAKSSPRSRSPNVRLGSGAAGRGFEPMYACAFMPASLSLRWGTAGVCPAHHSPESQRWSFCLAQKMFRGKAAQELRFAARAVRGSFLCLRLPSTW